MEFVKIRRPYHTDAEGNIESCLIYTEGEFTNGDIERLKKAAEICYDTSEEDDETFDELIERAVAMFGKNYPDEVGIVYPYYEIDI